MELSDYLRILRQRGWLIILLAFLTAGAAFGFSRMQTEVYESKLRLLVQPARTDFGQAQAAKTLLLGYVEWMRSRLRAADVIDALKLDMTPDALLGDVEVASDESSFVIQLSVENTDPNLATDIARTWGDLLVRWQQENNADAAREDRINIERIDDPQVGLKSPKTTINTAAGFVFGALLGILVVFALEWLASGIVRRTEDVERYLNIPVIGSIPGQ
jgi:capsular polysaccharide biosynthesis protein